MLQKTLLNIEGLGRDLDPELDLWKTAKPYLERWMNQQIGWRGLARNLKREMPRWASLLPQLPRLAHQLLAEDRLGQLRDSIERLAAIERRRNRLLLGIAGLLGLLVLWQSVLLLFW